MTKFLISLMSCLLVLGCVHSPSKGDIEQWEKALKDVEGAEADEDNAEGAAAYRQLIQSGSAGYQILSDAWVRGNIWLESWIQWEHDFITRYFIKGDETPYKSIAEYDSYVDQRLLEESNYFYSALKYLASEKGYKMHPSALAQWLAAGTTDTGEPIEVGLGHRKVAYAALKTIDPEMPGYAPDAPGKTRAEQFKEIEEYFAKKDAESQGFLEPSDPFSN